MYSKEQQLSSNRIKPKKANTFNIKKAIKKKRIADDKEIHYMQWLHEDSQMSYFKCFVCGCSVEHYHHIKKFSTDSKNHYKLLPLCNEHHLGQTLSPHGTPKLWRETYIMEQQEKKALELLIKYKESL